MPGEKPPAANVTDRLLATYVSSDRKVLDFDGFKVALVKALSDAYEQGLQDGLVTRTTGPDAWALTETGAGRSRRAEFMLCSNSGQFFLSPVAALVPRQTRPAWAPTEAWWDS